MSSSFLLCEASMAKIQRWDAETASHTGSERETELKVSVIIGLFNHTLWLLLKAAFSSEQHQSMEGKNRLKTKSSANSEQLKMMSFCFSQLA